MRNQHTLDRPSENPVECRSRRTTVEENSRANHAARQDRARQFPHEPSKHAPPSFEPVARKLWIRSANRGGVAVTMKEHDLSQEKASAQHNLVDVSRPLRLRSLGQRASNARSLRLPRSCGEA